MNRPKIAIRVCNWIGDVIMNLPAIDNIRTHYPDAEIVAVARPWVGDILKFRKDLIDRCIDFDDKGKQKNPTQFWRFCRKLKEEQFDMAFVLTKHLKGPLMAWLAGIPVRVGFATGATGPFLSHKIRRKDLPGNRHQSQDYMDLLPLVELEPDRSIIPRLSPSEKLIQRIADKFLQNAPKPILAVHAGAAFGTAKRWLPDRYAEVCRDFLETRGGTVALLGVASEQDVNDTITRTVNHPNLRNLCGQTTLEESMAVISHADVFLSNDSGLMHAAGAFGTPQVAIYGPTDITSTYPLNESARTIYKKVPCSPCFKHHCPIGHDCMKAIETEEVRDLLNQVLPV